MANDNSPQPPSKIIVKPQQLMPLALPEHNRHGSVTLHSNAVFSPNVSHRGHSSMLSQTSMTRVDHHRSRTYFTSGMITNLQSSSIPISEMESTINITTVPDVHSTCTSPLHKRLRSESNSTTFKRPSQSVSTVRWINDESHGPKPLAIESSSPRQPPDTSHKKKFATSPTESNEEINDKDNDIVSEEEIRRPIKLSVVAHSRAPSSYEIQTFSSYPAITTQVTPPSSSSPTIPTFTSKVATTTSTRAAKLNHYLNECTMITPYLYVSGTVVASSLPILKSKNITHIVNCCGNLSECHFPDEFKYLRLCLLDRANEDIICVLYTVIDFINAAREANGITLVHCMQGVSRSTVLVIAYLMCVTSGEYEDIYAMVRAARGITRPNLGFMCQLLAWKKRMNNEMSESTSQMYRLAPHSQGDPRIVYKLCDTVNFNWLDCRCVFVIHTIQRMYVYVGSAVSERTREEYLGLASHLVKRLQQYEFAPFAISLIESKLNGTVTFTDAPELGIQNEEREKLLKDRQNIPLKLSSDSDRSRRNSESEDSQTPRVIEMPVTYDDAHPEDYFYYLIGGHPIVNCTVPEFNSDLAIATGA